VIPFDVTSDRQQGDPAAGLPPWARVADGLTVITSALLASVVLFGPVRLHVGEVRLSVGSLPRVGFWLVAIVAVRHLLAPGRPLPARLYHGVGRLRASVSARSVLVLALTSRLTVLLVGFLAVVTVGYPAGEPPIRVSANELWNLPLRWDAGWYLGIAAHGYRWTGTTADPQNIAFFPAYPLLVRAGGALVGGRRDPLDLRSDEAAQRWRLERFNLRFLLAGQVISLAAFAWALGYVFRLAREELGAGPARRAVLLIATYPFAVFFSAVYTESLMLLAMAGCFYHFRHQHWMAAAAWGLVAGLTRPNGFLIAGPLMLLAVEQARCGVAMGSAVRRGVDVAPIMSSGHGRARATGPHHATAASGWRTIGRGLVTAAAPIGGMLLYSAFVFDLTGDPFAWIQAHEAWGRRYTGLEALLVVPADFIASRGLMSYIATWPIEVLNVLAAWLALLAVWPIARRLGLVWASLAAVLIVPPLLFGGVLSAGRLTAVLFPLFLYLASVLSDRRAAALACGFAGLQGLGAVLFFTWRPFF